MKKVFLFMLSIMLLTSCTVIDSGSIGIKFKKFGVSDQGTLAETCKGFVWFNPFTERIFEYETFVQRKNYEPFTVNAKDASTFTMDPQLAYHINQSKAIEIFTKYRKSLEELENGYIRTCIYEAYRTCANNYTSDSLMSNRAQFELDVRQRLEKSLASEGFIVDEFTSAITPPASLSEMIDAKNRAKRVWLLC